MIAISQKNVFIVALILFVLLTGWMTVRRSLHSSNDFDTYYKAGEAVLHGQGIYYTGEYYQDDASTSPFLYPPAAACFFSLFALLPFPVSAFIWNAFNILLFAFCVQIVFSFLKLSPDEIRSKWKSLPLADKATVIGIPFALLFDNLSMAQSNILVFFLLMVSLLCWQQEKDFLSGLVLAFSVMLKVTPALFCLYFLLKKAWRVLAGFTLGVFLLTLIVPPLFLGWEQNRIFHRQWLGRTIKPMVVQFLKPEPAHPRKRSAELFRHNHLVSLLTPKNQSFEAAATRLFLKNRNAYAYTGEVIETARKYEKLPVLFGGLPRDALAALIKGLQLLFFIALILFTVWRKTEESPGTTVPLEISLFIASFGLFSPLSRSHQFVHWLFPYLTAYFANFDCSGRIRKSLITMIRIAAVLYLFQALPYGKAAGFGAWSRMVLWLGFAIGLFRARTLSADVMPAANQSL